jgi:3-deoxy-D-manno-octulosonic-acid transferase
MYFIYSLLLVLGFLILLPRFLFDAFSHGKYVAGFRERLGLLEPLKTEGKPVIWIHCVSVGETQAARPLVKGLRERFPNHAIAVSTITLTGQNIAREVFKDEAARVFYFPFDWRWIVRRTLRTVNPVAVLIMETELWPNFLRECRERQIPVAIVNGRLSDKSFRRYKIIKGFMSRILSALTLAAVQTEPDKERLRRLGLDESRIFVTGSTKFDAGSMESVHPLTVEFRERFNLDPALPLILAASTHAPEEKVMLEALKRVSESSEFRPRLIVAPRHPERFREVAALIEASGLRSTNRTAAPTASDQLADVILLDSIGELRAVYSLASVVFVGGSIARTGGHNILEPAAVGAAVVTGAHTFNFKQIVETFVRDQAVIQLPRLSEGDATIELSIVLKELLADPDKRTELGRRAMTLVDQNRGATARTLDLLSSLLVK